MNRLGRQFLNDAIRRIKDHVEGSMKKVYLAGPDVFTKDPKATGESLKKACAELGLIGLFPFDNEIEGNCSNPSLEIYKANIKMIEECDGVLANVTPFRGAGMDVGTAFEIGYAKALGKPIVAYKVSIRDYAHRAKLFTQDPTYPVIEDFGLYENLMIVHAVTDAFTWECEIKRPLQALKLAMELTRNLDR